MSQFTLNDMKFWPKLHRLWDACGWKKWKKTTFVNWAEVIEVHDLFNRATHLGQIKIDEHSFNYIRETTLHWHVFVFKFLFCREWAADHRNGRLISLFVIKTCPRLFVFLYAIVCFFDLAFLVWNSLHEERGNKRTVLETTSPWEISIRMCFANGYFLEKSFRSKEEPRVSPFEGKSTQDGSKRLHYPSRKNVLVTWQFKLLVEGLSSSSVCFLVRSIAQLWKLSWLEGNEMNHLDTRRHDC